MTNQPPYDDIVSLDILESWGLLSESQEFKLVGNLSHERVPSCRISTHPPAGAKVNSTGGESSNKESSSFGVIGNPEFANDPSLNRTNQLLSMDMAMFTTPGNDLFRLHNFWCKVVGIWSQAAEPSLHLSKLSFTSCTIHFYHRIQLLRGLFLFHFHCQTQNSVA